MVGLKKIRFKKNLLRKVEFGSIGHSLSLDKNEKTAIYNNINIVPLLCLGVSIASL